MLCRNSRQIIATVQFVLLNSLLSEPFLAPNDPFIRHEIRYLGDEGGLIVYKTHGL